MKYEELLKVRIDGTIHILLTESEKLSVDINSILFPFDERNVNNLFNL